LTDRDLWVRTPRRDAQRRDLYDATRSSGADRGLAAPLQCRQAALIARLSATGSRSHLAASIPSALRWASARPDPGRTPPGSNLAPGIAARDRPPAPTAFATAAVLLMPRRISIPEKRRRKAASCRGSQYLAIVWLACTDSVPWRTAVSSASAASAALTRARTAFASLRKTRPPSILMPRPLG
jgi:hypothetical protein